MKEIFITGGTGYMGARLIPLLLARGYSVNALIRKGSEKKVPPLTLQPLFKILEWIPSTSEKAKALRLVSIRQMLNTLLYAVENKPLTGTDIIEINRIRQMNQPV